jgi:hypothetical protein
MIFIGGLGAAVPLNWLIELPELWRAKMGYAVYWNESQKRFCGYGVPAYCDHPTCKEEIDRGMGYVCGEPLQDQFGCAMYFCTEHTGLPRTPRGEHRSYPKCKRCSEYKTPYKTTWSWGGGKPEHPEWIDHLLFDESWAEWRSLYPDQVKNLKLYQRHYEPKESSPCD